MTKKTKFFGPKSLVAGDQYQDYFPRNYVDKLLMEKINAIKKEGSRHFNILLL